MKLILIARTFRYHAIGLIILRDQNITIYKTFIIYSQPVFVATIKGPGGGGGDLEKSLKDSVQDFHNLITNFLRSISKFGSIGLF